MNNSLKYNTTRQFKLPTALLMLALGVSFASVGQAQDIPQTMVRAKVSLSCVQDPSIRDEMQTKARRAVWDTRIRIASDLNTRLHRQHWRSFRVAGEISGKRG